jgi:hypothetical protein
MAGVCDIRFEALLIVLVKNLLTRFREHDTVWSLLAERSSKDAPVRWRFSGIEAP